MNEESTGMVLTNRLLSNKYQAVISSQPSNLPSKSNPKRKWLDRLTSVYYPPSSFVYDIAFLHDSQLGIQIREHSILFAGQSGGLSIGCCIVYKAETPLDSVIQPGDILLKINDISLLGSLSDTFDINVAKKLIAISAMPRTIRFMRAAGSSNNCIPSPIELMLYLKERVPACQFISDVIIGDAGKVSRIIEMNVQDNGIQVPASIQKMMNGVEPVWENEPGTFSKNIAQTIEGSRLKRKLNNIGIYRDRSKYVVLIDTTDPSNSEVEGSVPQFVGKYDSEEEANFAYKKAQEFIAKYGVFTAKVFDRQMDALKPQSVTLQGLILKL